MALILLFKYTAVDITEKICSFSYFISSKVPYRKETTIDIQPSNRLEIKFYLAPGYRGGGIYRALSILGIGTGGI